MRQDFITLSDCMIYSRGTGFIYAFSNPSYPKCIKIGRTNRLPGNRALELSLSTSALSQFVVDWVWFIKRDLCDVEKEIHNKLSEFRVNDRKEFFNLTISDAIKKITRIISDYYSTDWGGIKYRKQQDAKWGFFFTKIGVPFEYITAPIKVMGPYGLFLPDFFLLDQDAYLIISKNFLYTNSGMLMGYSFVQKTDKILFQFWDCQPGLEYDDKGDFILHTGVYLTPEGDFDGCIEWGICPHCGSKHIGHFGFPELCDSENRNTSKTKCECHTNEGKETLDDAYELVNRILPSDE